jgi:hypothetical protein
VFLTANGIVHAFIKHVGPTMYFLIIYFGPQSLTLIAYDIVYILTKHVGPIMYFLIIYFGP